MKINNKYIIVILLVAVSAGLAYDSVNNYINPYIPVADITTDKAGYEGRSLQVIGEVEPGSVELTDDGRMNFILTDGVGSIPVTYRGLPPSNLEEPGSQVVVLGELNASGEIESEELLVKCPSKYEGEDQGGVSHVFLAAIGIALLGAGYLVITMFYKK